MAENTTNKIGDIITASLEKIRTIADAETVIGEPINTPSGTIIIPVSKISVGFASGGLDYGSKKPDAPRPANFGGGGGTGISISPVAFLVVSPTGGVEVLPVGKNADTTDKIVGLVDRAPDIIERVKNVILSDKKSAKEAPAESTEPSASTEADPASL